MRLNTLGRLGIDDDRVVGEGRVRPRRLALLAILAAAGARGASRDQVLAILWPDSEPDRGRHALSQTLYSLRRDLGADVVLAAAELCLDPTRITTDLDDFRAAASAEEWERAAELYAGPFLDGFYLSEAPQFERWVEEERSRLARVAACAIEHAAREAAHAGRREQAAGRWRTLTRIDGLSGRFAASYMDALVQLGDRSAALGHGQAHAELVRRELDADPDPEVDGLIAALRGRAVEPPEPAPRAELTAPPGDRTPTRHQSTWRRWAGAATFLVAFLAIGAALRPWADATPAPARAPVLAVGRLQDLVTPDSAQLGGVLSEMLATSLGRLTDLQVVANSRLLELIPRGTDTARTARTDAARRAGATELLEGELFLLSDRLLRFELRRVDMRRGIVLGGYQVTGVDRMALLDSVTVLLATDLRVAIPTGTLAEVSTRSPIAYRLYEEGLRAFFQFDSYAANRLLTAAVREDSTFAMATYFAWRSEVAVNGPRQDVLADRAVALASGVSERDRLLILAHVGMARGDVRALPAAESLATRFPNDPEALVRAAAVVADLSRAIALLNRSIAIDSVTGAGPAAVCRLCDALHALAGRYDWADSIAAVERTLHRWSRLRPTDHTPWAALADYLVGVGRRADAEAALRRADALGAPQRDLDAMRLVWSLRSDDLDAAGESCRRGLVTADPDDFIAYRWLCTIALRMQGRHRDALALARESRAPGSAVGRRGLTPDRVHGAILDLEMGRPLAAEAQFAAFATEAARRPGVPPGILARTVTWNLTLAATAAAAGGDTVRVRALADSVESVGQHSLFARDPLLHHFLRGLLLASARQHEGAVRAFRAAMHSPSQGYTRINYELARSLLALGRPAEAIPVLRAALHGGIEGSGLYLTRTETHELLAQAFDAAGQPDSAAAHFAVVERAWRAADPLVAPRHAVARRRLADAGRLPR